MFHRNTSVSNQERTQRTTSSSPALLRTMSHLLSKHVVVSVIKRSSQSSSSRCVSGVFFFVVPGASEVYRDAMIQPLRWCTSQISSRRGSSIFTCEQDLTTKPNKWGASHLPLLLDPVMSLWSRASWDVCFLHPCTAPHLPNYIYTQASQPTQLY